MHRKEQRLRMANSFTLKSANYAFSAFDSIGLGQIHDRAGLFNLIQILQSIHQDLPLNLSIKRIPHGMA